MHTVFRRAYQSFSLFPVASLPLAAKSMLSATSTCSKLRASRIDFSTLRITRRAPGIELVERVGGALFRCPRLSQPKRTNRLLYTAFTCGSHGSSLSLVRPLKSQAVRGSRSFMGAASIQAALAQQQQDVKDRTAHQKENPLDSILLQADYAVQPFMASPAEQPARARVDYSKSQRPLQVLTPGSAMRCATHVNMCRLLAQCHCFAAPSRQSLDQAVLNTHQLA